MSDMNKQVLDLTGFGCPLHTQKAREAVDNAGIGEQLLMKLNRDALDTVVSSLQQDGQKCEQVERSTTATTIRVTKQDD